MAEAKSPSSLSCNSKADINIQYKPPSSATSPNSPAKVATLPRITLRLPPKSSTSTFTPRPSRSPASPKTPPGFPLSNQYPDGLFVNSFQHTTDKTDETVEDF